MRNDSQAANPGDASTAITCAYCHQARSAARQFPAVWPRTNSGTTADNASSETGSSSQEGIR